jgi:hypothetical protein
MVSTIVRPDLISFTRTRDVGRVDDLRAAELFLELGQMFPVLRPRRRRGVQQGSQLRHVPLGDVEHAVLHDVISSSIDRAGGIGRPRAW